MGYWSLTDTQRDTLIQHAKEKRVLDLGAGDLSLAIELLSVGARQVTAVEPFAVDPQVEGLQVTPTYYQNLVPTPYDLAVLSWPWCPANAILPLLKVLQSCSKIAYLGSNHSGIACGSPALYGYFLHRELLDYHPNQANSMIILGCHLATPRNPVGEEAAGIDTANCYSYPDTIGSRWRDLAGPNWQRNWRPKLVALEALR